MEKAFLLVNSLLLTVTTMIMGVSSRSVARDDLTVAKFSFLFSLSFLFLFLLFLLLLLLLSLSLLLPLLFNLTYTCLKLTRISKTVFFQSKQHCYKINAGFFHTARVKRELAHISPVLYPQGSHSRTTTHACDGLGFQSHFYSRISTTIRSHPDRPVHRSLQLAKDVFLALPVKVMQF